MPSTRRQIMVRVDEDTEERMEGLLARVKESVGINPSMSDLFRMGIVELEKKFPREPRKPRKPLDTGQSPC